MPERGRAEVLILALGLAVDLLCRFFPARLPYLLPFIFNAPVFFGTAFVLLWYVRGMARLAPSARPGWVRRAFFLTGVGLIYFVLQTHFEYVSQHMFFLNRIQAVVLGMVGPFCVAIGWMAGPLEAGIPAMVRRVLHGGRFAQFGRVIFHPLPAMALFLVTSDVWLIPSVHFAAMIDPVLYMVMNLSCLIGGLIFWCVVLDPRPTPVSRFSYLTRAAAGFLVMFPQIGVSAYIALTTRDLYSFYTLCGRLFPAISPAYDQMLGGLIQWIPPGMMNTAALIIGLNSLRLSDLKADKDFVIPVGATVYEAKWTGRR